MTITERDVDRIARAHVTESLVLDRIAELWRFRAWYRRQVRWDMWMDLAIRNDHELRALVTLARRARRLTEGTELAPDDMTTAKAWGEMGWSESELAAAWGR
jgi:hypothetical protein